MSQERPSTQQPNPRAGVIFGVVSGALAMLLLWLLSAVAPLLLALLIAGVVAGAGGAVSAKRLRRGPAGANLVGLCALGGTALIAVPLLLLSTGPGLNDTQSLLFGIALAAICAMGGQIAGSR